MQRCNGRNRSGYNIIIVTGFKEIWCQIRWLKLWSSRDDCVFKCTAWDLGFYKSTDVASLDDELLSEGSDPWTHMSFCQHRTVVSPFIQGGVFLNNGEPAIFSGDDVFHPAT